MLSVLSFHVISSHQPEDLYNYLLLYSLWFENNPPELYLVNSLDSLKKSCTRRILNISLVLLCLEYIIRSRFHFFTCKMMSYYRNLCVVWGFKPNDLNGWYFYVFSISTEIVNCKKTSHRTEIIHQLIKQSFRKESATILIDVISSGKHDKSLVAAASLVWMFASTWSLHIEYVWTVLTKQAEQTNKIIAKESRLIILSC